MNSTRPASLTRRQFLNRNAALTIGLWSLPSAALGAASRTSDPVRLGLIADTHVGLAPDAEQRLDVFLKTMADQAPDGLVQLGDFAYPQPAYQKWFDRFNQLTSHPIHTIGNHDYDHGCTAQDCRDRWGIPNRYYRHRVGPLTLLVLDGNEKGSPTHAGHGGYPSYIGPDQQAWLKQELQRADAPVLLISHQPLAGRSQIDNAEAIRTLLAPFREKLALCLNGHSHIDQHLELDGINYVHVNSASYYWLGGKQRWATYRDPLFSELTFDFQQGVVHLAGRTSDWATASPQQLGYFDDKDPSLRKLVVPRISERQFSLAHAR